MSKAADAPQVSILWAGIDQAEDLRAAACPAVRRRLGCGELRAAARPSGLHGPGRTRGQPAADRGLHRRSGSGRRGRDSHARRRQGLAAPRHRPAAGRRRWAAPPSARRRGGSIWRSRKGTRPRAPSTVGSGSRRAAGARATMPARALRPRMPLTFGSPFDRSLDWLFAPCRVAVDARGASPINRHQGVAPHRLARTPASLEPASRIERLCATSGCA